MAILPRWTAPKAAVSSWMLISWRDLTAAGVADSRRPLTTRIVYRAIDPTPNSGRNEFTAGLPVPTSVQDLVIYELHIGALGFGGPNPGSLDDAVGAAALSHRFRSQPVELLPMSEFAGMAGAMATRIILSLGQRLGAEDKYKYFVREMPSARHRRHPGRGVQPLGLRLPNGLSGLFDSEAPEQNIYYWYEGRSTDYPRLQAVTRTMVE
jgi:1,4-alpha-glucan branching enzyme